MANAYAQGFVEMRRAELRDYPTGPGSASGRGEPPQVAISPSVVVPARPARSPLPPWPSETWTVAGMFLVALALAIPGPEPTE
ncbi:MAG: hypothetical protein ABR540_15360 [Acidimicrobiales bacterium]